MWVVAGTLLGILLVATLLGFHAGPHVHAAGAAAGIVAGAWLIVMAATGPASAALWTLFSADVVVSGGVGYLAYRGLVNPPAGPRAPSLAAADAVALTDLAPSGIVRMHGEDWSAVAVNGKVPAGTPVQVLRREGVRLEVWGERPLDELSSSDAPGNGI